MILLKKMNMVWFYKKNRGKSFNNFFIDYDEEEEEEEFENDHKRKKVKKTAGTMPIYSFMKPNANPNVQNQKKVREMANILI